MQLQVPSGSPQWSDGGEQRLFVSMLLATLLVGALLSIVRAPALPVFAPLVELIVKIVRQPPAAATITAEPEAVVEEHQPADDARAEALQDSTSADSLSESTSGDEAQTSMDIATASRLAIDAYLDRLENPYSVNPVMAAKRREFEGRYQPPTREGPKPIWENVEKDQLGRTVLRSGDCYKVLEDPNVGSQDAFRDFHQYIVTCVYQKRLPRNLPWVAEIRERYHYLKYPDGYVPEDESAE